MSCSGRTIGSPRGVLVTIAAALLLAGCSGAAAPPPTPVTSPAASAGSRAAEATGRGTATCISNDTSRDLQVEITRSDNDSSNYDSSVGRDTVGPGTTRCMKGRGVTVADAPLAVVSLGGGRSFTVQAYDAPIGGCAPRVTIQRDTRCMDRVGGTSELTVEGYAVTVRRIADSEAFGDGTWIQIEVRIRG